MFLFLNGEFHLPGKWSVLSEHKLQIIVPFGCQTVGSLDEQAGWKWMPGSSRLAEAKCMDTCACVAACFHFLYAIYVCVSEKALQVVVSSIHSGFKSRLVGKYNFNCMYMSSTITATMFALAALSKQTVWKGLGSSAAGPVFYFLTVSHFTSPCQEIWEKNQNALTYLQGVAISKHFSHPSVQLLLSQIPGNDKKQTLFSPFSTSRSFSHSATQPLTQVRHWVKGEPV